MEAEERTDAANEDLLHRLRQRIEALCDDDALRDSFQAVRSLNGLVSVSANGLRNHHRYEVIELFGWLGRQSRSCDGLLYVRDDDGEGDRDRFRVYRLTHGSLSGHEDPFFD